MPCCETTHESIKYNLPATDLEAKAKSDQFVGIKEEINPDLEKDGQEKNIGMDIVKLEEPDDDESIGDVVVTNLCNLVI